MDAKDVFSNPKDFARYIAGMNANKNPFLAEALSNIILQDPDITDAVSKSTDGTALREFDAKSIPPSLNKKIWMLAQWGNEVSLDGPEKTLPINGNIPIDLSGGDINIALQSAHRYYAGTNSAHALYALSDALPETKAPNITLPADYPLSPDQLREILLFGMPQTTTLEVKAGANPTLYSFRIKDPANGLKNADWDENIAAGADEFAGVNVTDGKQGSGVMKRQFANRLALALVMNKRQFRAPFQEVGAYAMARACFLPREGHWDSVRIQARDKFEEIQAATTIPTNISDQVERLLGSKDPKSIWELANIDFPVNPTSEFPKATKLAQHLLLDTPWNGTLNLNDPDQVTRFTNYLGADLVNECLANARKVTGLQNTGTSAQLRPTDSKPAN